MNANSARSQSLRLSTRFVSELKAHEQNAKLGFRTGFEQNELSAGAPEENSNS